MDKRAILKSLEQVNDFFIFYMGRDGATLEVGFSNLIEAGDNCGNTERQSL